MKQLELSNIELSDLCRELGLLLHAGVSLADGLYLLSDETKDAAHKEMLTQLARSVEQGCFLAQAFEQAGCFPVYITGLLQVGERVGRTEETLYALARYYEQQDRTNRHIRSALTYPAILLLLMTVVIVVLLSRVLPVFNEIYASLGGRLTGVAGGLLMLGRGLDRCMPILFGILVAGAVFFALFSLHRGFHKKVMDFVKVRFGDRGVFRSMNNARFAQALSMGFSSGMTLEESVDLAAVLLKDVPDAAKRCDQCRDLLAQGETLAHALGESCLMSVASCRLLTLGMRGGSADSVMDEIARRMQEEAQMELENMVAKIEPALVLVTSALVGVILLSVMLPLMNIMTAIG